MSTETPQVNTKPKSIADQLSEALTNFKAALADKVVLQTKVDEGAKALKAAEEKIAALELAASTRETEFAAAGEKITSLTTERDNAKAEATKLKGELADGIAAGIKAKLPAAVTEEMAKIGIKAKDAPKTNDDAETSDELKTEEQYAAAISAEKDPYKKKALFNAMEKKFGAGKSAARN